MKWFTAHSKKTGFPPPFYLSIFLSFYSPVSDTEKGNNTNIHNALDLLLKNGKSSLPQQHHPYSSPMGSYRYPIINLIINIGVHVLVEMVSHTDFSIFHQIRIADPRQILTFRLYVGKRLSTTDEK
ncbi:hypothetical protein A8M56_12770 [Yersinia pestis]|nr:hypothetical protein A8M56_12770 [Yersinia pestis]